MRWPWQRRRDAPVAAEIEEQTARHMKVLQRARRAEQMIVDDYARADQQRVAGRPKP